MSSVTNNKTQFWCKRTSNVPLKWKPWFISLNATVCLDLLVFFCSCSSFKPHERDRSCAREQRSFVAWFNVRHHHVASGPHSSPPLQVCLNFLRGDAGETPGMCAALTDRGINRGIVPDLPTPDWRKTNSPPMGPEQIKYTLPSSTPGVTAIRGGLSAGGTERGCGGGKGWGGTLGTYQQLLLQFIFLPALTPEYRVTFTHHVDCIFRSKRLAFPESFVDYLIIHSNMFVSWFF